MGRKPSLRTEKVSGTFFLDNGDGDVVELDEGYHVSGRVQQRWAEHTVLRMEERSITC